MQIINKKFFQLFPLETLKFTKFELVGVDLAGRGSRGMYLGLSPSKGPIIITDPQFSLAQKLTLQYGNVPVQAQSVIDSISEFSIIAPAKKILQVNLKVTDTVITAFRETSRLLQKGVISFNAQTGAFMNTIYQTPRFAWHPVGAVLRKAFVESPGYFKFLQGLTENFGKWGYVAKELVHVVDTLITAAESFLWQQIFTGGFTGMFDAIFYGRVQGNPYLTQNIEAYISP